MMSTLRMQFFSIIGQGVPALHVRTDKLSLRIYYIGWIFLSFILCCLKSRQKRSFYYSLGCVIFMPKLLRSVTPLSNRRKKKTAAETKSKKKKKVVKSQESFFQ